MRRLEARALKQLCTGAQALGWQIAFNSHSRRVKGLVIGTPDYVDFVAQAIDEKRERRRIKRHGRNARKN